MLDGHYQRWFRCLSLSLVICVTSVDSTACMLDGHYQRWFRCLSLSLVICVTSVDSTACMLDGHYQRWFRCLSLSLVICVTSVEHCWFSVFVVGLMFELCEVFLFCFFSHCFYFYGLTSERVSVRGFEVCVCLWQSLIILKWLNAVDRRLVSNY